MQSPWLHCSPPLLSGNGLSYNRKYICNITLMIRLTINTNDYYMLFNLRILMIKIILTEWLRTFHTNLYGSQNSNWNWIQFLRICNRTCNGRRRAEVRLPNDYIIVIMQGGWGRSHCINKLYVNTGTFHLHSKVNKLTVTKTAGNTNELS